MTLFWPGCNCCDVSCVISTDDFASLGSWTQVSGSWSIVSGAAKTASTNAVLMRNSPHPNGHYSHVLTIDVRGADGDIAKVLFGTSNGSSVVEVAITFGDPCGSLSLNGGTAVEIDGALPDTWITLRVCFESVTASGFNAKLTAYLLDPVDGGGEWNHLTVGAFDKSYIGLGTGATAADVRFDNLAWNKGPATEGCPGCEFCNGALSFDWTSQTGGGSPDPSCRATMTGTVNGGLDGPASFTPLTEFHQDELDEGISGIMTWSSRPTDVTIGPARFELVVGAPTVVKCYISGVYQGNLTTAGNGYGVGLLDGQCCAFVVNALGVPTNTSFVAPYTGTYTNIGFTTTDGTVDTYFTSCTFVCPESVDCNQCSSLGDTPTFFKVVIAGMVSGTCDASLINGTYIIEQADSIGQPCWWRRLFIPLAGCDQSTFNITLKIILAVWPYTLSIHTNLGAPGEVIFDLVLPSVPIRCDLIEDDVLTHNAARSAPDGAAFVTTAATFTLTAL